MTDSPKAKAPKPGVAERVEAWLSTEGFPFEMEVAATFLQSEYSVSQAVYYIDDTTQKSREVDITATTSDWLPDHSISISVTCVAECKYSRDKPWVLLTSRHSTRCGIVGISSRRVATNENGRILAGNLKETNVPAEVFLAGPPATGYSAVTAFRGNSPVDEAFGAPLSAAKAARAFAQIDQKAFSLAKVVGHTECRIWIPLVVLDGLLFTATLVGSKNLLVKEVRWGRLLLKNPDAGGAETAVDLVTAAGLVDYARGVRSGVSAIGERVRERPELAKDAMLSFKGLLGRAKDPAD